MANLPRKPKSHADALLIESVHLPISIRVGYEWDKTAGPRTDLRWQFIRKSLLNVAHSVDAQARKRRAPRPFSARVSRMRAQHGSMVLSGLMERCAESDILVFDLAGLNPNVMLEIGLGLAAKGFDSGRVFVFQEVEGEVPVEKAPSDLEGFLFTRYEAVKTTVGRYRLKDLPGFNAALRARLVEDARLRGMWVDPRGVEAESESDEEEKGR